MKSILRRTLCCVMSLILIFSSAVAAFAAKEESETTPVVVVNDINLNPIFNTDDGSVVFTFSDYEYDLLFTSGFSSNITDLFSSDLIEDIKNGDMAAADIMTLLVDAFGFGGDINTIVNKVLDFAMTFLGTVDIDNIDFASIISSIDFKQYADDLKNSVIEDINNIKLLKMNPDGTPANSNIGGMIFNESLEYYFDENSDIADILCSEIAESVAEEIGYDNTFVFTYDWRLSPMKNAALLEEFIADVKESTSAEKVSVISEGYGSLIATQLLADFPDTAADSILNFVTVSSEYLGTSLVGDFFSGDITNKFSGITEYTSAYLRYMNDLSDNPITAFVMWLLNYIMNNEWELQSFTIEIQDVLSELNVALGLIGITEQLSFMEGIWALVPVNDYEDAYNNLFSDEHAQSLIDSVDEFKLCQENYEDILLNAKDSGINISVVAAWDLQILPIGENVNIQSDGIIDTEYASFGATCVELNAVAYAIKAEQWMNDGHDHMSATYDMLTPWYAYGGICAYIDASSCALPENTWFIKNMKHNSFNYESNSVDFLIWLVTATEEKTVWQDAAYKQFMTYNRYINPGILSSDGLVAPDDLTPGTYLLGDVNLDGYISALDAYIAMTENLIEGSLPFINGDINGDGEITDEDIERILLISSGLDEEIYVGTKLVFDTEDAVLPLSDYEIEIRPAYNPVLNECSLTLVLLDAKGSYCGNFVVNYSPNMLTFTSAEAAELNNGKIVAGVPHAENTVTCSFSSSKPITSKDCDEDGNLVLAVFKFDVARNNIQPVTVSAGTSYFYDDDERTYIAPVQLFLDEEFFTMYGDADDNRYITAADARTILRISAKLEQPADDLMYKRCDVNQDGNILAIDARLALRASAKLIKSYDEG